MDDDRETHRLSTNRHCSPHTACTAIQSFLDPSPHMPPHAHITTSNCLGYPSYPCMAHSAGAGKAFNMKQGTTIGSTIQHHNKESKHKGSPCRHCFCFTNHGAHHPFLPQGAQVASLRSHKSPCPHAMPALQPPLLSAALDGCCPARALHPLQPRAAAPPRPPPGARPGCTACGQWRLNSRLHTYIPMLQHTRINRPLQQLHSMLQEACAHVWHAPGGHALRQASHKRLAPQSSSTIHAGAASAAHQQRPSLTSRQHGSRARAARVPGTDAALHCQAGTHADMVVRGAWRSAGLGARQLAAPQHAVHTGSGTADPSRHC
jgi:hypothetical protein